jgi:ABC-type lipoprotein release transport system permease subunit
MKVIWWKLAWRNLWRNRRRTFITAGSAFFAVFFAVMVQSLIHGVFGKMIDDMARLSTGHIQVQNPLYFEEPSLDNSLEIDRNALNEIREINQVSTAMARIESAMLASTGDISTPVAVVGVDAEAESGDLQLKVVQGTYFKAAPGLSGAMVGEGLAEKLELSIGDTLLVLGQGYHSVPAYGRFSVQGLLNLGNPELSNRILYVELQEAQHMFRMEGRATGIAIIAEPGTDLAELREQTSSIFSGQKAWLWDELLPDLKQTLEGKLAGNAIILFILYLIIGFGMFSTVLMMMSERKREMGILISVGTGRGILARMVYVEVLLLGLLGVGAGCLGGWPLLLWLQANPITMTGEMAEVYAQYGLEPVLPVRLSAPIFFKQGAIVLSMAAIVGLYPIWTLRRLDILKATRS